MRKKRKEWTKLDHYQLPRDKTLVLYQVLSAQSLYPTAFTNTNESEKEKPDSFTMTITYNKYY